MTVIWDSPVGQQADSRQTSRRLRRLLPQATVTLLPDSGHVLLGQTERILKLLAAGNRSCDA
jgi:hypothetical protein